MHLEAGLAGGDGQALIAELPDDVEGLARWLLERESHLVLRDLALDDLPHVRGGAEVAVGGHGAIERLVRTTEVVVIHEVLEAPLRVDDVREDGAAEKLVPQGLPEALDLAEGLRVLRSAADVANAEPRQLLFELGLAAPDRVLPTVVRQHFLGLTERRDAALERFHYQRRLLMVRERMADDEPAVVVHEHARVQPLATPQPEREDVRLPQLVGRRAFEAPRPVLALRARLRCLDETLVVKDAPDLVLAHPERREAREYVANPTSPPIFVIAFERDDLLLDDCLLRRRLLAGLAALGHQRTRPLLLELRSPLHDCRRRDAECTGHVLGRHALHAFLDDQQLVLERDLPPAGSYLPFRHVPSPVLPTGVGDKAGDGARGLRACQAVTTMARRTA